MTSQLTASCKFTNYAICFNAVLVYLAIGQNKIFNIEDIQLFFIFNSTIKAFNDFTNKL